MDHYGVIGNPIQHSKSPLIHRLFAEQTGQNISYTPILVELDGLANVIDDFQSQGGKGLNITLPFKNRAFHLVNSMSERALIAKSINTIKFNEDHSRYGDNTDGVGLIKDIIINQLFPIQNKRVLVLGAGGAVSGIIDPLLNENPSELVISNRTANKAFSLAENFVSDIPITACGLQDLAGQQFDLIINGTSASLQGEVLDLPDNLLSKQSFCYDMVYGKGATPFLKWAHKHGASQLCDGMGMLVEQAAESFYLWRNVRPDTRIVLTLLKSMENHYST
jgi:shikimate dehydrogenase